MNAKLPVMVFIHGGQFTMDSSDPYTGGYFLDEQVVLVTINYRLHSLGKTQARIYFCLFQTAGFTNCNYFPQVS